MDPKATLMMAAEAVRDGNREEALDHLADYQVWRDRGGFEPVMNGDLTESLLREFALKIAKPKNAGLPGFDAETGERMTEAKRLANLTMN